MRKLLFRFTLFVLVWEAMPYVSLMTLVAGVGAVFALVALTHLMWHPAAHLRDGRYYGD